MSINSTQKGSREKKNLISKWTLTKIGYFLLIKSAQLDKFWQKFTIFIKCCLTRCRIALPLWQWILLTGQWETKNNTMMCFLCLLQRNHPCVTHPFKCISGMKFFVSLVLWKKVFFLHSVGIYSFANKTMKQIKIFLLF